MTLKRTFKPGDTIRFTIRNSGTAVGKLISQEKTILRLPSTMSAAALESGASQEETIMYKIQDKYGKIYFITHEEIL